MPRRKPPSRVRYEAEHPSLTVRVPAQVKARVLAAAQAEGLSVSEWVHRPWPPDTPRRLPTPTAAGRRRGGSRARPRATSAAARRARTWAASPGSARVC